MHRKASTGGGKGCAAGGLFLQTSTMSGKGSGAPPSPEEGCTKVAGLPLPRQWVRQGRRAVKQSGGGRVLVGGGKGWLESTGTLI
jgi:hypothetical protein